MLNLECYAIPNVTGPYLSAGLHCSFMFRCREEEREGGRVSVTNRFFPSLPPLRFPIQIKERPLSHTAFKETMRDQERSSVQQDSARRSIASWQKMSGWLFSAVTMLLISFRSKQSKSIKCKKYWTGPLKRMGYELPSGNWCLIRCLL